MPDLSCAPRESEPLPDRSRRFGNGHRAALNALITAARDGTGCAALTGEAGTAKTALLDATTARLKDSQVQVIRVRGGDAPLTAKGLLAQIAASEADDEGEQAIEQALPRLLAPASPWKRTILMIDDAHLLQRDALAYLQLACGLQAPDVAGLQILFAGRPEFWSLLQPEHLRSLRDCIRCRVVLPRLARPSLVQMLRGVPSEMPHPVLSGASVVPPRASGTARGSHGLAKRRSGTRFAMASGVAATVLMAGIGPLSREPTVAEIPKITAGYAAPVHAVVAARSDPRLRPQATDPIGPAFLHASAAADPPIRHTPRSPGTDSAAPLPNGMGSGSPPSAMPVHTVAAKVPTGAAPTGDETSRSPGVAIAHLVPPRKPSASAAPPPAAALSPATVKSLLRHGNEMLRIGDIAAARLLFRRAAEAGSAAAALAIGRTNDPRFLAETGAQGILPDPTVAAEWYRKAAALGERDADRLLEGLGASAAQ